MKKIIIILIIIITSITIWSFDYTENVNSILHFLYMQDYEKANMLSDSLIELFPDSPVGKYMKFSIINTYMSDFETDTLKNEFFEIYEEIIKYRNSDDAHILFFVAGAYFQKASFLAMKGNYPEAIKHGLRANTYFNKSVKMDEKLFDAYLGRGLVDYFRARMYLKIGGNGSSGKNEIKIAAEKGLFSKVPAMDMLAILYQTEGKNDSAKIYIDKLRCLYPENRMFMFTEYKILYSAGDYENAIILLNKLIENILINQKTTYYNIASVYYEMALCYHLTKQDSKAMEMINNVRSMNDYIKNDKRIKKIIEKAGKLENKLK